MQLRKHQQAFQAVIDGIIAGSKVRDIIVVATPGAGKSTLPVQATKLIKAGKADRICWICPRASLQDQGERNFVDPFFREMFGHEYSIRSSTNEHDPSRGLAGWISTMQAIVADKQELALREFAKHRYIIVIDEVHHCEAEEGEWMKALAPLYDAAKYRILLTGTLERGDEKKIAFIGYDLRGDGYVPILEPNETTAVIRYSRTDALADRAIIPLVFQFLDGSAKWETQQGKTKEARLSHAYGPDASAALYTALRTDYARHLLEACVAHWKADYRRGKLLVVAPNIKTSKTYLSMLKSMGIRAKVAASDDDAAAVRAIKEFKSDALDVLVCIGMCYEGLDVPQVSHIACLTHYRSTPWITQMSARAVRIDPRYPYDGQIAYVFAPDDVVFRDIARAIEQEQVAAAKLTEKEGRAGSGKQTDLFGGQSDPAPGGIKPLESRMTGRRSVSLSGSAGNVVDLQTPREQERELREKIDQHVKAFCRENGMRPQRLNGQLLSLFGRSRADMRLGELQALWSHCQREMQLRHGGRMVQPINVRWA